ncbi:hypothetical protein NC652_039670 [Populus alba x Populus x berolinensis]|nr:hypothetical protein NC652_039670 [Populus alba x Populus x berolinensis]
MDPMGNLTIAGPTYYLCFWLVRVSHMEERLENKHAKFVSDLSEKSSEWCFAMTAKKLSFATYKNVFSKVKEIHPNRLKSGCEQELKSLR